MTAPVDVLAVMKAEFSALPVGKGGLPNGNACNAVARRTKDALVSIGMAEDDAGVLAHGTMHFLRRGYSGSEYGRQLRVSMDAALARCGVVK